MAGKKTTTAPPSKKTLASIGFVNFQKPLAQKDTEDWVKARTTALDNKKPNRIALMEIYRRIMINDDVFSAIETRKLQVKGLDYRVRDKRTGKEDETLSNLLKLIWFDDLCDAILDATYYGYTAVEMEQGDNEDMPINVHVLDREHFIPQADLYIPDTSRANATEPLDMADYPYLLYYRPKPKQLGLLDIAVPLVFPAQYVIPAWAEHAENFGHPYVMGFTNTRDEAALNRMNDIVQGLANGSSGVFDTDEVVKLLETMKSDPHNIYEALLKRCESKLVKLIAGQTLTATTDGTYGQGMVHLQISDDYTKADTKKLLSVLNSQAIRILQMFGYAFAGKEIYVMEKERVSFKDKFDMAIAASQYYDIPEDYFLKEFGIPVIKKAATPIFGQEFKKKIAEVQVLYKGAHIHKPFQNAIVPDTEIEAIISAIKNGDIIAGDVPADMLKAIADYLQTSIENAYGTTLADADLETTAGKKLAELIANAQKFAGYKTYQQIKELAALPNNQDFQTAAEAITKRHNGSWLDVEAHTATMQAHSARQWVDFEDNPDYPHWKYETVGDSQVRDEHKALDGKVFAKNDPKTQVFFPPNGYGCRCDAQEVGGNVKLTKDLPNIEDVHPLFRNNAGVTGEAFSPEHPYFQDVPVSDQDTINTAIEDYISNQKS